MTILNWFVAVLLLFWPFVFITSVMGMGGPGATNDKSNVLTAILILLYPVAIFFIYSLLDVSFFIWSGNKIFVISTVILVLVLFVSGYLTLYVNLIRGIQNEGYSIVGGKVYYDAAKQADVDSESFKMFPDMFGRNSGYALDMKSVYFRGDPILNADSQTFEFIGYSSKEESNLRFDALDSESIFFDGELVGPKLSVK
jgi:DKNYY family